MHSASLESIHNIYQLRIHTRSVFLLNVILITAWHSTHDILCVWCVLAYVNIWTLSIIMQKEVSFSFQRVSFLRWDVRLFVCVCFFLTFCSFNSLFVRLFSCKMKFILMRLRYCYYLYIYRDFNIFIGILLGSCC